MKQNISLAVICLMLLAIGFACGRYFQHFNTGYHHQVRDTKEYDSPVGPIRWSYVTESVGTRLLDPGTTLLEVDGRTIYKAKRGSRESFPYARNIKATTKIRRHKRPNQIHLQLRRQQTRPRSISVR